MITFYYKEVYKMKEKCPVCDYPVDEGATKCENCGFADELGINRDLRGAWTNTEDANYWLDTVVKPYRVQWEAWKQIAGARRLLVLLCSGRAFRAPVRRQPF
jgi:hypothetical protein